MSSARWMNMTAEENDLPLPVSVSVLLSPYRCCFKTILYLRSQAPRNTIAHLHYVSTLWCCCVLSLWYSLLVRLAWCLFCLWRMGKQWSVHLEETLLMTKLLNLKIMQSQVQSHCRAALTEFSTDSFYFWTESIHEARSNNKPDPIRTTTQCCMADACPGKLEHKTIVETDWYDKFNTWLVGCSKQ